MQTIKLPKNHVFSGIGFEDVTSEAIELAKRRNVNVEFHFANTTFTATPTSTVQSMVKEFDAAFAGLDIHSAKPRW